MSVDRAAPRSRASGEVDDTAPGDVVAAARLPWAERDVVLAAAVALVVAQLALRFWMLWPSWFYGDDYALIGEAQEDGSAPGDLLTPYSGQFMPLGRAIAGLVGTSYRLDWHTAALSMLVMVAVVNAACVWMLVELFGRRRAILLPLVAYLTSAIVMPATMWWAAGLNQIPLQAVMFAAVAAWVRYLRTGSARWWAVVLVVLAVGLLAYVKTLLVLVVLAWLTLAHFASGSLRDRLVTVVKRHAVPLAVVSAAAIAFLVYFTQRVPSIVTTGERRGDVAVDVAGNMLGRSLPVGLLGGPWRWNTSNAPAAIADPPGWAVLAGWVVLAVVVAALVLTRRRVGRVVGLLATYAVLDYLLLLVTRAQLVGGIAGLEYRYLTDLVPVAVLCLGLATMTADDAEEPTEPRPSSALRAPRSTLPVAAAVLAVSGLASSVGYAHVWHSDHPGRDWFEQVSTGLGGAGALDVADAAVPEPVVSGLVAPWNRLSVLLPRAGVDASFPKVSSTLTVLDESGAVQAPIVDAQVMGATGPVDGCGWPATSDEPTTIPLEQSVQAGYFWLRLGYLTSKTTQVTVTAGAASGTAQLGRGLGSVFVDISAGADSVTVEVAGDATVCIGDVQAGPLGQAVPQ